MHRQYDNAVCLIWFFWCAYNRFNCTVRLCIVYQSNVYIDRTPAPLLNDTGMCRIIRGRNFQMSWGVCGEVILYRGTNHERALTVSGVLELNRRWCIIWSTILIDSVCIQAWNWYTIAMHRQNPFCWLEWHRIDIQTYHPAIGAGIAPEGEVLQTVFRGGGAGVIMVLPVIGGRGVQGFHFEISRVFLIFTKFPTC